MSGCEWGLCRSDIGWAGLRDSSDYVSCGTHHLVPGSKRRCGSRRPSDTTKLVVAELARREDQWSQLRRIALRCHDDRLTHAEPEVEDARVPQALDQRGHPSSLRVELFEIEFVDVSGESFPG